MTVILIDPTHPVLPVSFLEAVLGRGEAVEIDPDLSLDLSTWGIKTSKSAPWFITANPNHGRPEVLFDARPHPVVEAVRVMQAAVGRGDWERRQTHESLIPYLREESEEFIEAIRSGNDEEIRKELGDVFLQVLFHAEIADRRGQFELSDVAASFVAKMRSRAPYLFDGSTGIVTEAEQERLWALGKAQEKLAKDKA
ncbi:MazG nucleotide pyrophosphohydrolase domain-containing protein [Corynebacterium callunae]|uniref:MazG nucleotide pyrophosphohydrolase domain-containing protein n=1 Tax=Corynebacterium callunae TaxID=1721 RepID=UPI003982BBB6